jgi:hypothetical protein
MCSAALVAVQLSCEHEAQLLQQVYCSMQCTASMADLRCYLQTLDRCSDYDKLACVPVDVWHWLRDGTGNGSGFSAGMLASFQDQSAATQPRLREQQRRAGRAGLGDQGEPFLGRCTLAQRESCLPVKPDWSLSNSGVANGQLAV